MTIPSVGDAIPELAVEPTTVQLFQFSAATGNAHRIHYDPAYAYQEGYPGVLVQSHLHACFLLRAVRHAAGPDGRLERFGWQNRGIAVPGDRLMCTGRVANMASDGVDTRVDYEVEERNQRGELCARAWATVLHPRGAGQDDDA
jgi:hydroxyacyl-ACP dehydratase HTD2-like protein with hotdog domain